MEETLLNRFVADLLIVLTTGFVSGAICRRLGVSLLVGYLVVGAFIGDGGLQLVSQDHSQLEYFARAGVLLLLFAVGIEFSLEDLLRMSRHLIVGGGIQMLLVAVPLTILATLGGLSWRPALLVGAAAALSSTVLVFKALTEWGQASTPHGRRAIGILLFQDIALVPLMLLVPFLTESSGQSPTLATLSWLALRSLLFLLAVVVLRRALARWAVPLLASLRSLELVVLFTLSVLTGMCWGSVLLGLPPAVGALAAGLVLSGNRLSKQIDALILPYRESFAAVFFVTLGTLLYPAAFFEEPLLLTLGIVGVLTIKSLAAAVALKVTGLSWRAGLGMGLGLAQLGEFSFLLVAEGVAHNIVGTADYNRVLFIALGTLVVTPQLIKYGLQWAKLDPWSEIEPARDSRSAAEQVQHALVIGLGPIGRQLASQMETFGVDVRLIDLSPINLHSFAQAGFPTVVGDARDPMVLARAQVGRCRLVAVCVPDDDTANQIVRTLRDLNPTVFILVRCRYLVNLAKAREAGANAVISEEQEASGALMRECARILQQGQPER